MKIDLLFDPFGASWHDIQEGAIAAEGEGFDGVWLCDHLAGSVHGQQRVLECWTTLTAIAATVPRIALGPMVLNVANRHPGTLGVMAATLQEVSGGRLLLEASVRVVDGIRRTRLSSRSLGGRCLATRPGGQRSKRQWRRSGQSGQGRSTAWAGSCVRTLRHRSSSGVSGRKWPSWLVGWPTASTCRLDPAWAAWWR